MLTVKYPLFYVFHFYLFGVIAIAAALTFVTRKSPIAAALWLVVTMFSLAALFVMLDAQFLGAMQVMVYAGAIMVVFLFVVMLLNVGHASLVADARGRGAKLLAGAVGLVLIAEVAVLAGAGLPERYLVPRGYAERQMATYGATGVIARPLYREYALPFELTSVLLLVAIAGAVVVGKKREARDAG